MQTPRGFGHRQIKKRVVTQFDDTAARDITLVAGCHRHKFHRNLCKKLDVALILP